MVIVEDFDDPDVLNRDRAETAGRDRAAVRDRGARHLRDLVDRHLGLPGRRRRRPKSCSSTPTSRCTGRRSLGATPTSSSTPNLARATGSSSTRSRARCAPPSKEDALDAALPAGGAHHRPDDHRRRGAAALARRRAWRRPAAGVHSAGRGIGPDPRARRLGAAHGRRRSASAWRKAGCRSPSR